MVVSGGPRPLQRVLMRLSGVEIELCSVLRIWSRDVRRTQGRVRRTGLLVAGGLALAGCLPATAAAAQPPDGRGYELVSPVDKNGTAVQTLLRPSKDGPGYAWVSLGAFGDVRGANAAVAYAARRTEAGWITTTFHPRFDADVRPDLLTGLGGYAFPDDLSSMTWTSPGKFTADDGDNYPGLPMGPDDVYRVDGNGISTLLSHGEGLDANAFMPAAVVGMSGDGTSVFFTTAEQMTTDVPLSSFNSQLYRWRDGVVTAVGFDPEGTFLDGGSWLANNSTAALAGAGDAGELPDSVAVSKDGSRFAYSGQIVGGDPTQLYLAEDGAPVRQLSLSQRDATRGDPSASDAIFVSASADLSRIYFQSRDRLTNDAPAGGGLYVYDVASGDLSFSNIDQSPYSSSASFGDFGLVQVSEDGAYVYYVAPDVLAAGAVGGSRNLYVQHDGQISLIGILAAGDIEVASTARRDAQAFSPAYTRSGLSADGTRLVFESLAVLPGSTSNGRAAIYLYDAVTESLDCVSCRPDGAASQGDATVRVKENDSRIPTPTVITNDGSSIVFTSNDDILPRDTNRADDVYEYRDGRLMLVSGGLSKYPSILAGMSADGTDLYFRTGQRLVARDTDNGLADIYDARMGGGEPTTSDVAPPCRGDECQGAPSPRATLDPPGSSLIDGSDEEEPATNAPVQPRFTVAKVSAGQLRTLARGGRTTVAVKVNTQGRVGVVLRAKLGRRSKLVASGARTANRAGTVKVAVKLSPAARAALKRSGRLRVTMSVSFTDASSKSRVLTLRASRGSSRNGGKR